MRWPRTSNYFKFGGSRHSPDHRLRGLERRPERLGILHDPRARLGRAATTSPTSSRRPAAAWSGARTATSFFYVQLDDNHRPLQVFRHRLGTPQADDVLVYEEQDAGWFTHIA